MVKILGVKIDNIDMAGALAKAEEFLSDNKQHYIVTTNPEFIVRAQKDNEFREILNKADLSVADGVGVVWAAYYNGIRNQELGIRNNVEQARHSNKKGVQKKITRIAGVDLMEKICERAAIKKWPVFLYGGKEGVAEKAAEVLRGRYEGLEIRATKYENSTNIRNQNSKNDVFARSEKESDTSLNIRRFSNSPSLKIREGGVSYESDEIITPPTSPYIKGREDAEALVLRGGGILFKDFLAKTDAVEQARQSKGAILFVALGAPKQEKWIAANLKKMPQTKLVMGVGGAFDFISGRVRRAPLFIRRIGLEWLWRLVLEPWRIGRVWRAVVVFPYLVIRERIRNKE